jgi:osmotically-inducible protein OsmY
MIKILKIISILVLLSSCSTVFGPAGKFGTGVSITFDPRTVGMQIDDTIMQKSMIARLAISEKKYFLLIQVEVLDGHIFITGKVDEPEEKIKITKLAWETRGVRSVKNAIQIRGQSNFKSTSKDILITTQLRAAMIISKTIKSSNYTLETINKKIYIFGISFDEEERKEVLEEANKIYGVKDIVPTIYLVSDLSRNKI